MVNMPSRPGSMRDLLSLLMRTFYIFVCFFQVSYANDAALDMTRCCVRTAREQWTEMNVLPWDACIPNSTGINPTVNTTRQLCEEHKCYRFVASSFSQWSDLLTTFIAPALGLLIICPIGSPGFEDDDEEDEVSDPERGEDEDGGIDPHESIFPQTQAATEHRHIGNVYNSASTHTLNLDEDHDDSLRSRCLVGKKRRRGWPGIVYTSLEYINLLGDPASAIAGSVHQLLWDRKIVQALCSVKDYYVSKEVYEDALRLALLCGQTIVEEVDSLAKTRGPLSVTEFELSRIFTPDATLNSKPLTDGSLTTGPIINESLTDEPLTDEPVSNETITDETMPIEPVAYEPSSYPFPGYNRPISSYSSVSRTSIASHITKREDSTVALLAQNALKPLPVWITGFKRSKIRQQLDDATGTVMKAKVDFTNGIVVPIVLTYAGCAAGFYGAYKALGDRDKAFSLSFGVSYAWLLVLAVVSNSSAVTVNSSLLEPLLASLLYDASHSPKHHIRKGSLSFHIRYRFYPRVVPFRKRMLTTAQWSRWIDEIMTKSGQGGFGLGEPDPFHHFHSDRSNYSRHFFIMQVLGWACTSAFVACGAFIAWQTPTLGLGCRSFTLLLYMLFTFVTSLIHWLRNICDLQVSRLASVLKILYRTFTFLGAFVLVGGTAAQLIGLFQRCSCSAMFQGDNALIVLNTNTQQDIESAKNFWLPVGYVAFLFALILSSVAVILREYIFLRLTARFLQRHE